ncbi:hypothetical protein L210DRAFT_1059415 [Boletus edulis BED1]|uniref:F-box domain-containing protein n=1 Tax=Boletus edulis BED1 TaxID=1328754 RepID=A0AAD4BRA6_BOLED|nr:hypothetical protein L210DRAFT_1059415 [Boletus edulis BED1]
MANVNNQHSAVSVPAQYKATMKILLPRIIEELIRRKTELFDLYARRNSPSFIFRLPTEILELIFIQCACDYYVQCNNYRMAPCWANVSYVCRHWRDVALNCSELWTYLCVVSPRWMVEQLARSKQAPLKLFVYSNYYNYASQPRYNVKQAMDHVERIQELHLLGMPLGYERMLFPELSLRAPRLKYLKVSRAVVPNWSSVLFDGDTPSLQTLELSPCPIPWYLLKLNGLTTLSLNRVPGRFQQNTADFLATLSRMQDLTNLYLQDALASAADFLSSEAFHTVQKVNLPHLSHLLIVGPLSTVVAFLSCVNIPLKAEVRLRCVAESHLSHNIYAWLSWILQERLDKFENQVLSHPTIRSLIVQFGNEDTKVAAEASLTASVSECTEHTWFPLTSMVFPWTGSIPLHVVLCSKTAHNENRVLREVCSSTLLADVQSMDVTRPPFSSTFWTKTLGRLPNLRRLKLIRGNLPDLASVLSLTPCRGRENKDGNGDGDSDRVLAPALEELRLSNMSFSPTPLKTVQSLWEALSSRKAKDQITVPRCVVVKGNNGETPWTIGRREMGLFPRETQSSCMRF